MLHKIMFDGERMEADCGVFVGMALSGLAYWLCMQMLHTGTKAIGTDPKALLAFAQGCGYLSSEIDKVPASVAELPTTGLFVAVVRNGDVGHYLTVENGIENGMASNPASPEPMPIAECPWREHLVLRLWKLVPRASG